MDYTRALGCLTLKNLFEIASLSAVQNLAGRLLITFRKFAMLPIYGAKNCLPKPKQRYENKIQWQNESGNSANLLLAVRCSFLSSVTVRE